MTTGDCDDEDSGSVTVKGGFMTNYTVTGIQEGSSYIVTVTASNDNRNKRNNSITTITQATG